MTAYKEPRLLAMGDTAWTIELGSDIDLQVNLSCLALTTTLNDLILKGFLTGIKDVVPTFRSVTVHYDPLVTHPVSLGQTLIDVARNVRGVDISGRHWHLPVCFDDHFGLDFEVVSKKVELDINQVIARLLAVELRVYAMGFMPGFAYMAHLPSDLHVPRLKTPRTSVPPQSLAIAGEMACIYPWDSPGGWNVVGRMPVPLFFSKNAEHPGLFNTGDKVTFYRIDTNNYHELHKKHSYNPDVRNEYLRKIQS